MNRYRISETARSDLLEAWRYISSRNLDAADQWLDAVQDRFRLLGTQPEAGQLRADLHPGIRFLPLGNYLIFYRATASGVEIARVLHGARDYKETDF